MPTTSFGHEPPTPPPYGTPVPPDQPPAQTTNEPEGRPAAQPTAQPAAQPVSPSVSPSVNQPVSQATAGPTAPHQQQQPYPTQPAWQHPAQPAWQYPAQPAGQYPAQPAGQYPPGQYPAQYAPQYPAQLPYLPPPGAGTGRATGVVVLRSLGLLAVVGLLLAGAGSIVTQFFQQQRTESKTLPQAVSSVVARTGSGDIRIRTSAVGTLVTVTQRLHWSFHEPAVKIDVQNGVLTVSGSCDGQGPRTGHCATDLDITVPPGIPLDLSAGAGDIRTSGTTGAVLAETRTGSIAISDSTSPKTKISTGIGDITVSGAAAEAQVTAHAGRGDLHLRLDHAPSSVQADNGIGDIRITVPAGDAYRIDSGQTVGDVVIRGVARDASAPRRITVDSGTGDVLVQAD